MTTDVIDIDEADILVYQRGLLNTKNLTNKINSSLNSIQTSTYTCQKLFEPILYTNQRLATLSKNIEKSLDSIASIKDVATDASKHDLTLSQPIEKVGLSKYFKAIYKIEDLLESLSESTGNSTEPGQRIISSSNEFQGMATNLQTSLYNAEQKIQKYFVQILNTLQPFDPQLNINKRSPFPYFEDSALEKLTEILNFFHGQGKYNDITQLFITQRSEYLLNCMAFCEQFTKSLSQSEQQPYERGTSGVISYSEALSGFIMNEQNLLDDLKTRNFDSDSTTETKTILIKVLSPVITSFSKIVQYNIALVKGNPMIWGNFVFELSDCITKVLKSLGKISFLQQQLEPSLKSTQTLALDVLSSFISYIATKASTLSSLPSDFGITGVTIDVMSKLRKLSDYSKEISHLLQKLNVPLQAWINSADSKWCKTFSSLNKQELGENIDSDALLACYYGDCLDALCVSLESRATVLLTSSDTKGHPYFQAYQSDHNLLEGSHDSTIGADEIKSLVGFFLISNISLIEQILSRSPEVDSALAAIQQRQTRLHKLKKRYLEMYLTKWKKCTQTIMLLCTNQAANTQTSTPQQIKKQKESAKETLKNFNIVFDVLNANFKNLKISDQNLKKGLVDEIKRMVDPVYKLVWSKYKDTFKNREKYLKYTPEQMTSVLNGLSK